MSPEEIEEQAIAYLLDELSESERSDFSALMARDSTVAALVEELESSMGLAALSETELREPSPELRDRILADLPKQEKGKRPSESSSRVVGFPVAAGVVGWAAAAALVYVYFQERDRSGDLEGQLASSLRENEALSQAASVFETQAASLSEELKSAVAESEKLQTRLEEGSVQLASARSDSERWEQVVGELQEQSVVDKVQIAGLRSEIDQLQYGITVWDTEADSGVVKVFNLPELDTPTEDYQLWVIAKDEAAPISAGVFQVDSQGNAEYRFGPDRPVQAAQAFAISRERKGGSSAPQGQIVLSGTL